jgi:hypothetical protein
MLTPPWHLILTSLLSGGGGGEGVVLPCSRHCISFLDYEYVWNIDSIINQYFPVTPPFSCLIRHTRACGGPILTRILTGPSHIVFKNILLIWRRHQYRWRAAEFRSMLGAQGLWAGRDLYRATPTVTRGVGFSGLIRRTAPFSRLLRHTRGCGGFILTRILTGL